MKSRILIATLLLFVGLPVQAEPLVSINPAKSEVAVGETFSVDIIMTDFPASEGGGLTLGFKPTVVKVNKVSVNTGVWSFASKAGVIDNVQGEVSNILFSKFPGVSGNVTIATVELQAVGIGPTQLKLLESSLNPFASRGQRLAVTFSKGKVVAKTAQTNGIKR